MNTRINLTGKNSNDIYTVNYPRNLLYFMKYDFNLFMERCVDLCKLYMKTGEYRQEEAAEIRNSISGCHKYVEQNIRSVFEKIVIDCWIEYICRQNEIGVITLWNNYIPCRNEFEKAVFMRLSEYRHGYAINQWVNVLKIQEYANIKTDFVFGSRLKSNAEAAARANYFDLMFNVVANELGYDLNAVADNKVFTVGRTPNSPFIMSSVSREIVRNLLTDLRYGNDSSKHRKNEAFSDQTAMDAFAAMKAFLPEPGDNVVETMIKSLAEIPVKVYMPASLKAAVDLEIDVIIESGAYLQKCELCKDYYLRSEEYDHEYCDSISKGGKSCLEIMAGKKTGMKMKKVTTADTHDAESIDAALLNERCERLYKEMSARINAGFTQRDFSDWCRYLTAIRDNILSGKAGLRDFENFAEYSRAMSFLPDSASGKAAATKDDKGRTVKPFVFERVDRREVEAQAEIPQDYEPEVVEETPAKPIISRVSSKIIRGVTPEVYTGTGGVTIPYVDKRNLRDDTKIAPPVKDEDVKVFSPKGKETVKPEEHVKIFQPTKKLPRKAMNMAEPPAPVPVAIPIPEKPRVPAFSPSPAFTPAPALSIGGGNIKEQPDKQEEEVIVRKSSPLEKIYASQKNEETMELGFHELLRGLERKDGFSDESIPTDSEGVPVSHKTKRVMDAIFKQSKPSLFVNINKGDE